MLLPACGYALEGTEGMQRDTKRDGSVSLYEGLTEGAAGGGVKKCGSFQLLLTVCLEALSTALPYVAAKV
jgi:hypothetical protein